jgi:predicted GIY-YIG superfamily endonuclease
MPYVYILENEESKYYVGSTTDLERRMEHHMGGYTPSTHRMGKLRLVLLQEYKTLLEARRVEFKLKSLKRHDYIANIVKDGFIKIKP